jgi:hypothetical protein
MNGIQEQKTLCSLPLSKTYTITLFLKLKSICPFLALEVSKLGCKGSTKDNISEMELKGPEMQ